MSALIAGNWKMHKGPAEALAFLDDLAPTLDATPVGEARLLLFPSAVALPALAAHPLAALLELGCQTVHPEVSGAFTGEISAEMAREAGAVWSLVGHSERRHLFGESDADVAARVVACRRAGIRPMVCVGENLEERRAGRLEEVLARQITAVLGALGEIAPSGWAIAWEPVWAIGTGEVATPADAAAAHDFLGSLLEGEGVVPPAILYGGSVKPENAGDLLATPGVDGVLVGGASLDPASFVRIARAAATR
ncbi:MAG: triose-phosphate isomerase [Longimicrobiales bacterium]|nr:triose-phosphate isomerase [Longimicrobiales bacterium]